MSSIDKRPSTALCDYDAVGVRYRGRDLVRDLLTKGDFVQVMSEHILGRPLSEPELRVINATLIVLMEHGMTPSSISSRLVYMSAPENLQGAVAAGLLAVGSQFIGTMENNALLLKDLVAAQDPRQYAKTLTETAHAEGRRIPGFGHHLHRPDDPRALRLLELADDLGVSGQYVSALRMLSEEVDRAAGKHITINATGAVAALLCEIDIPVNLVRGFAVISRAAGLVAHIAEEQKRPTGRYIWSLVEEHIHFEPE